MLKLTNDQKQLIIKVMENDYCLRCTMKYLGVISSDAYQAPRVHINKVLMEIDDSLPAKEFKKEKPCQVCLGILEDETLQKLISEIPLTQAVTYKHCDFLFNISLPKVLPIREYSMFLYMKETFPDIYINDGDLLQTRNILQLSLAAAFSEKMGKTYCKTSSLVANIDISYENDNQECENIKHLTSKGGVSPSKSVIANVLENCDEAKFREHFKVPLDVPNGKLDLKVTLAAGMTYIGGRYLKFSRDMGQTPWIIDDKVMTKYCLSDIIFDSVEKNLGYKKQNMKFSASGREDSDVRMLGNGRPFYIQVLDAKDPCPTFEQFRAVEEDIAESKVAVVVKFQNISTNDIKLIKDGEEFKNKHYMALCHTMCPIEDAVHLINKLGSLEINQKTPLRVLHRRSLAVRKKHIYKMEAMAVPGEANLFILNVVTQAGTYVKEFVHGDFHRTEPNISQILGKPSDLVALDVTRIELEWPL